MESINKRKVVLAAAVASLVTAGAANAQTVDLNINENNVGDNSTVLPAQTLPNGGQWSSGYNGVYQFTIDSGPENGQTFWSTCLSPGGEVDYSTHTYQLQSFSQANPGQFPSAWATGPNGELWGIQNASFLWSQFGSGSSALKSGAYYNGDTSQQAGAALELAMYVALYNSQGYGLLGGSKFNPGALNPIDPAIIANMNNDLAALPTGDVADHLASGYMLVPDPTLPDAQQEFIILDTDVGNIAVPEPVSTSVVGGLIAICAVVGSSMRRKSSPRA